MEIVNPNGGAIALQTRCVPAAGSASSTSWSGPTAATGCSPCARAAGWPTPPSSSGWAETLSPRGTAPRRRVTVPRRHQEAGEDQDEADDEPPGRPGPRPGARQVVDRDHGHAADEQHQYQRAERGRAVAHALRDRCGVRPASPPPSCNGRSTSSAPTTTFPCVRGRRGLWCRLPRVKVSHRRRRVAAPGYDRRPIGRGARRRRRRPSLQPGPGAGRARRRPVVFRDDVITSTASRPSGRTPSSSRRGRAGPRTAA